MKKTLLLAASFLALTSVSAFAEGPYVAGDLGLAIVHDSDYKPVGIDTFRRIVHSHLRGATDGPADLSPGEETRMDPNSLLMRAQAGL